MDKMGEYIRHRRKVLKLTQEDLAARVGVSRVAVANWEAGKYPPAKNRFPRLARTLRTTQAKLLRLAGYQIGRKDAGLVTVPVLLPKVSSPDLPSQMVNAFRFERSFLPPAPDYLGVAYQDGTFVLFSPSLKPALNQWAVAVRNGKLEVGRLISDVQRVVLLGLAGRSFEVEKGNIVGRGLLIVRDLEG